MGDGGHPADERTADSAVRAMARAASTLAAASSEAGVLLADGGGSLTAERLRRAAAHALADASAVTVEADGQLRAGEPVVVSVARAGGDAVLLARTFAPDSDGGWERRAAVAVDSAIHAAARRLEPGVTPDAVRQELLAEIASFGFEPAAADSTRVLAPADGDWTEPADDPLQPGDRLALAPAVTDPDRGTVLVGDTVRVTEDGCELLTTYSRSVVPEEQDE